MKRMTHAISFLFLALMMELYSDKKLLIFFYLVQVLQVLKIRVTLKSVLSLVPLET